MDLDFKKYLLDNTKASNCRQVEVIQNLWSGYGQIVRYELTGSNIKTVIVKSISLEMVGGHPRGWSSDFGHNRKVKSYQVETVWYQKWNQYCDSFCRTPEFLGSFKKGKKQWIILEDLNHTFPSRRYELSIPEIKACLRWLANFHITFLMIKPEGLWDIGTYWHLATRPDEFQKIKHKELKANAHLIDQTLNDCQYYTFVHGDAKLANFCFSADGKAIAVVDFQYVGGGCGIKDVAYFLGSCLTSAECKEYEEELLQSYFLDLKEAFQKKSFRFDFDNLEEEWRALYPFACVDFMRFMLGWMPSHQKINNYNLEMIKRVIPVL